jgi:hypothetical protein
MRTFYAILVCLAMFVAYVLIGVSLGWKNGGGVIPNVIFFFCLAAVWKAIRGGGAPSIGTAGAPVPLEEWERQPDKEEKKDAS